MPEQAGISRRHFLGAFAALALPKVVFGAQEEAATFVADAANVTALEKRVDTMLKIILKTSGEKAFPNGLASIEAFKKESNPDPIVFFIDVANLDGKFCKSHAEHVVDAAGKGINALIYPIDCDLQIDKKLRSNISFGLDALKALTDAGVPIKVVNLSLAMYYDPEVVRIAFSEVWKEKKLPPVNPSNLRSSMQTLFKSLLEDCKRGEVVGPRLQKAIASFDKTFHEGDRAISQIHEALLEFSAFFDTPLSELANFKFKNKLAESMFGNLTTKIKSTMTREQLDFVVSFHCAFDEGSKNPEDLSKLSSQQRDKLLFHSLPKQDCIEEFREYVLNCYLPEEAKKNSDPNFLALTRHYLDIIPGLFSTKPPTAQEMIEDKQHYMRPIDLDRMERALEIFYRMSKLPSDINIVVAAGNTAKYDQSENLLAVCGGAEVVTQTNECDVSWFGPQADRGVYLDPTGQLGSSIAAGLRSGEIARAR